MLGQRTLQDLIGAKAALRVVWPSCRHKALIYPRKLGPELGWDTVVDEIIGRLRCSRCGHDSPSVYEATR